MAEALAVIAVIASVAQLADLGCKLSVKLFAFSQTAATADESVKRISSDVSLTSTVLQELSGILKADESHIVSSTAIEATKQTVAECLKVFVQLDEILDKAINGREKTKGSGKRGMTTFEKLRFPFKQPKLELLRSNLDRLKASLSLMLQVLSYARDVSNRKTAESSLAYQQSLIEAFARSQRIAEKKYQSVQRALEHEAQPLSSSTFISTSVETPLPRGLDLQSSHDSPSPRSSAEALPTAPLSTIHELLICFNLLHDVSTRLVSSRMSLDLPVADYSQLQETTTKIRKEEEKRLESEPANLLKQGQSQAAENLSHRLNHLSTQKFSEPTGRSRAKSEHFAKIDHEEVAYYRPPKVHFTAKIDAETASTIETMPETMKVQRGEKLDVIHDDAFRKSQAEYWKMREEDFFYGVRGPAITKSSSRSSVWSVVNSSTAFAGGGIASVGAGIYLAARAGTSWLTGNTDKQKHAVEHRLVTASDDSDHLTNSSREDEGDKEEDSNDDISNDLLAKWTNLPVHRD